MSKRGTRYPRDFHDALRAGRPLQNEPPVPGPSALERVERELAHANEEIARLTSHIDVIETQLEAHRYGLACEPHTRWRVWWKAPGAEGNGDSVEGDTAEAALDALKHALVTAAVAAGDVTGVDKLVGDASVGAGE